MFCQCVYAHNMYLELHNGYCNYNPIAKNLKTASAVMYIWCCLRTDTMHQSKQDSSIWFDVILVLFLRLEAKFMKSVLVVGIGLITLGLFSCLKIISYHNNLLPAFTYSTASDSTSQKWKQNFAQSVQQMLISFAAPENTLLPPSTYSGCLFERAGNCPCIFRQSQVGLPKNKIPLNYDYQI